MECSHPTLNLETGTSRKISSHISRTLSVSGGGSPLTSQPGQTCVTVTSVKVTVEWHSNGCKVEEDISGFWVASGSEPQVLFSTFSPFDKGKCASGVRFFKK